MRRSTSSTIRRIKQLGLAAVQLPSCLGQFCKVQVGQFWLASKAELLAHGSNIDYGYSFDAHHGDSNRDVFSAGPCDRLFYAPDESSASGGVLFRWPISG